MSAIELTPKQIVSELDKYIIGQDEAKRAVAIALRNRWRRQNVRADLRDEIAPKNIIMIGPTGVGKTEIARRLAKLDKSPFLKVEATKFTEVGYVGRDVESMIRDLMELAVNMVKQEELEKVRAKAKEMAEERLLDLLLPVKRAEIRGPEGSEPTAEREARRALQTPARSCARSCAKGNWTAGRGPGDHRKGGVPDDGGLLVFRHGGHGAEHQGDVRQPLPAEEEKAHGEDSRGPHDPRGGGSPAARRHGQGHPRGPDPRRAVGDHLPRRDRQDRRPRAARTDRTSPGRGSSGTSCPSWKAPRSTRSTAWSGRITSSSSPPGPSARRSPRT